MVNYFYVIFYDFVACVQLPGFWVLTLCRAVFFLLVQRNLLSFMIEFCSDVFSWTWFRRMLLHPERN